MIFMTQSSWDIRIFYILAVMLHTCMYAGNWIYIYTSIYDDVNVWAIDIAGTMSQTDGNLQKTTHKYTTYSLVKLHIYVMHKQAHTHTYCIYTYHN